MKPQNIKHKESFEANREEILAYKGKAIAMATDFAFTTTDVKKMVEYYLEMLKAIMVNIVFHA